jgi:protoporphyrinogen oxidase|tara:strand:+ start:3359 stop:4639 length:1281 start_codon:yes stop_codon:yes gene_type:complete
MKDLIVIGSGAMGLAAAYEASKHGKKVIVLEGSSIPGGMAAHFAFSNLSLERFYHFICKTDVDTFGLLEELGLIDKLTWKQTTSGYFFKNKLFRWGDPIALLLAPGLNLYEKIRYGFFAFMQTKRKNWHKLENVSATKWLRDWCGNSVYRKLWNPLFELKFHGYQDNISAAWIWTRIKRIGVSRYSIFREKLGFIDGGTETLVKALIEKIKENGGEIILSEKVQKIDCTNDHAIIKTNNNSYEAHKVICTTPIQELPLIEPAFPEELNTQYKSIENIGIVCVVLNLSQKVSEHFWLSISMPDWNIPGIIEFSNLRNFGEKNNIVYIPYYMPITNKLWERDDQIFINEAFHYIKEINPAIADHDLIDSYVGRLKNSQPICEPGFLKKIPEIQTPHPQLQIADTCYYYPEDRGISESVKLGRLMAKKL